MVGRSSVIYHPSWRVYLALSKAGLDTTTYGFPRDLVLHCMHPDVISDTIYRYLTDAEYEDRFYSIKPCWELFGNEISRQFIEGALLERKDHKFIADNFQIAEHLVDAYAQAFFDNKVWPNNGDRAKYVAAGLTGEGQKSKAAILAKGFEYFLAIQNVDPESQNIDILLMRTAVVSYREMENMISAGEHMIAQGWANTLIKAHAQLGKKNRGGFDFKSFIVNLSNLSKRDEGAATQVVALADLQQGDGNV